MINMGRHKACKLCRDRKVRCDGSQPACQKCRRLNENCVYSPTYKPTKADLAQTIETLKERIGSGSRSNSYSMLADDMNAEDMAESMFVRQNRGSAVTSNDQFSLEPDAARNCTSIEYPPFTSPVDEYFPQSRKSNGSMNGVLFNGNSSNSNSNSSSHSNKRNNSNNSNSNNNGGHTMLPPSPKTIDTDFTPYSTTALFTDFNPNNFRVDNISIPDENSNHDHNANANTNANIYPNFPVYRYSPSAPSSTTNGSGPSRIPSLREIRALNFDDPSSRSSPFTNCLNPEKDAISTINFDKEGTSRILTSLQTFTTSVFTTQHQIAGISAAVAEYLAWLRTMSPNLPKQPHCTAVLETLESRMKEMNEMADQRHWAAWAEMVAGLEGIDGGPVDLRAFGEELRKKMEGMKRDLERGYDIGKEMEEQEFGLTEW